MNELYDRLQAALSEIAPCSANYDLNPTDGGDYIAFTVSAEPGLGGDDGTLYGVAECVVYYVCPLERDPLIKRSAVTAACAGIADTLVRETEQSVAAGQVYVYTFQVVV